MLTADNGLAVVSNIDVQHHRITTDRTVFDIILVLSLREIDRHNNLFPARITDVAGFNVGRLRIEPVRGKPQLVMAPWCVGVVFHDHPSLIHQFETSGQRRKTQRDPYA